MKEREMPETSAAVLLRTALMLSDELHKAEQNGIELPKYVDEAWLHLSVAIEKFRVHNR